MGESAHFILIASTLLLIKSKSLLPELNLTAEEKVDMSALETRLKIYKRIKDASTVVHAIFGKDIIFAQSQSRKAVPVFAPDPNMNLENIQRALQDLLKRLPKKESLPQTVVKKVISLEDMIGTLSTRITSHLRMSFKEFTREHRENRVNVIVSFLAMLELVKQGVMHVSQEAHFSDITMETKDVAVPHY
jgi:segregation and condensation protein A